jgi:16S rRNA (cytosine1402-N4)-methyltransferase
MQNAAKRDSLPSNFPIRANEINEATLVVEGRAIKASDAEVAANPRSRSAVMRVASRTDVGQSVGQPA